MCSAGKYNLFPGCVACSNTTDLDCTTCALGTASTMLGRDTVCDPCEAGKYSHPANQRGALTCEWCGIGLAAPAGSSNCATCGNGNFAALGASACGVCPAGSFAVAPASACTSCPAGTFSGSAGVSVCQMCQAGTFSTALGTTSSATCVACQPGTYSPQRSSACTNCPANSWNLVQRSTRCTANVGFYNLDDSLRAYYPFNEGDFLTDVTGLTGNLLVLESSPTQMVSGPFSATSYSAWFDGNAKQYFTLPSLLLPNAMSICSWFWISPDITRKWNRVFDFGRGALNENVLVSIVSSSSDLTADVYKGNSRMSHHYWQGGATASVWRHVCLTVSGTNGNFWLDNISNPFTTTDNRNFNTLLTKNYIGRSNWWHLDEVWRGAFDEFRIYHKALSATEVAALYAFGGDSTDSMIILACPNPCFGGTFGGCNGDGTQNCTACGRGLFSSGIGQTSAATCQNCLAGTYSFPANTNGASRCEPCGAGLAAPEGSSNCTTCAVGYYAAAGFSACVICPAGTFATGLVSACSTCSAGTYASQTGATTCQNCSTCSVGRYNMSNCNSSANVVCAPCANPLIPGHFNRYYFTGPGFNGMYSCPYYCNAGLFGGGTGGTGGCYYCSANEWCLYNLRNMCPLNSAYPMRSSSQTNCKCNAGYYGDGGWSDTWQNFPVGTQTQPPANWSGVNCELCPAGKYNTGTGITTSAGCVSCVAGTYSTAVASRNSSSCISCLAGTYSTGTAMVTSAVCASCMAGTYSSGTGVSSSVSCTACISGTYSTGIGMTTPSVCQNCSVCQTGQYNVSNCNSAANVVCGACSNPLIAVHSLPARYYFAGPGFNGQNSCPWYCNPGFVLNLGSGYGSHGCWGCGNNFWCLYGISYLCPANSGHPWVVQSSQAACVCNAGYYGVGGWSNTWQEFPVGTQTQPPAGWSGVNCESCQAGKYNIATGVTMSSLCTNCISGTYSTGLASPASSTCLSCLSGRYSSGTGASSSVACTACISGTYSTNIGSTTASTCLSCQSGTYQSINGASSSSQCTLCRAGTYSTGTGAITSLTCQTCLAGKFSTGQGSTISNTCHDCEPGTFSTITGAVSSLVCGSCTSGNFASASGAISCAGCLGGTFSLVKASTCTNCSQGTFSGTRASACAVCQPGFFALDGAVSCTPCPAGSFNERNGSSNCSLCDTGSYSFSSMSACLQCGPGKYKPHEGCIFCLEPADDCYPCYPGSASAMMGRSTFCDWCKAGTYSYPPNTPGAQTCEPCGNGTISMDDGASDCIACTLGRYAPVESSACLECPIHTFLEERYKGSEQDCQPCARGTYSPFRGVPSRFACTACPAGTYESSRQCIPCQAGTYSPADGFTLCLECKAGSYSAGEGNTRCERCPLGKYTPVQSSSCQDCPFHTYLDSISQSSIQDCIPCPSGTYSLVLGAPTEIWCTPCLPGTYELSRTCQACSAGTFSNAARATTCMPCLPPTYSQQGASSCKSCPAGGFLDSSFTCISCAAGTYSVGGVTVCEACSIGTFSLQNSSTCLFCQPGAYSSSDASSSCELCGTGTFVSQQGLSQCFNCFIGRFSNESGQSGCRTCVDGTFSAAGSTEVNLESS